MFKNLEEGLTDKTASVKGRDSLCARHAMGAVIAYWKTNLGSAWALKWWENKLTT